MSIIFFDIDGTIMDVKVNVGDSVERAQVVIIMEAMKMENEIVAPVGGKVLAVQVAMEPQLLELAFDGLVCSCGQYIQLDGRVLRHVGFDRDTSRKILEAGRRCLVDMYFEEASHIWVDTPHHHLNRELENAVKRLERGGVRVGRPDGDPDFHFDKVCVLVGPDSRREEFLAEMAPLCQIIDRGGGMFELPMRGYSKASGCRAVAQALGADLADCYAIGDSPNDLEMLACVGHPLVMGDAPAKVQTQAEYVTAPLREDGLYRAMVHMGLLHE